MFMCWSTRNVEKKYRFRDKPTKGMELDWMRASDRHTPEVG